MSFKLNKNHPVFCRRKWFQGKDVKHSGLHDVEWFHPGGSEMEECDWNNGFSKSITIYLNGQGIDATGYQNEKVVDDCFMLMFNAYEGPLDFVIPSRNGGNPWLKVIDTVSGCVNEKGCSPYNDGDTVRLEGRSTIV